jgi:hypothetical protein
MGKGNRKLTPPEKAQKKRMRKEDMTIFINGKKKRVNRPAFAAISPPNAGIILRNVPPDVTIPIIACSLEG